jgi:uncharacterized membrane protein HdeD (DUF308 family)
MFPKEHGAYGQLLFPIATAFAIGGFSWSALALAAAAVCAFVAHEPLLVLIGQRGPRAQRELRLRAWRWLAGVGGAALIAGVVAVASLAASARVALGVTIAFAIGLALFIALKREHTLLGESWMSVTMGSLGAPTALAAGASLRESLTLACAFAAAFLVPTVAVHAVIAFTRKPPATRIRAGSALVTLAAGAVVAAAASNGIIARAGEWAVLPAGAAALTLALRPPAARRLRIVGWTLVATSTAASAILIAGL